MRRLSLLAIALAARVCVAHAAPPPPLGVVATIEPIAMIARELAGAHLTVSTLVPPGASPHTFDPRPGDVVRVARAALLIAVGGGLDGWTQRLLGASGRPVETLVLLELPDLAPLPAAGAASRGSDPHVWLDPLRVRDVLAPAIAARLEHLDPAHAADTAARLADLQARLTSLDRDLRAVLAGPRRAYVAFHAAWRYFGARYGLEEIGVIEETPGEEPGPRELAELVAAARAAGVRAILIEPQLDPRVARTLAAEFGATTILVDPNGDPTDPERAGYEGLLRWNARAFARALGGSS